MRRIHYYYLVQFGVKADELKGIAKGIIRVCNY